MKKVETTNEAKNFTVTLLDIQAYLKQFSLSYSVSDFEEDLLLLVNH